ncbi:MAG TPA: 4'-phosphopantetheinyl transferase superfamily protein [Puia sp.]|nr:4'-phosphopantetheinyl transferase superfamily protein [Puia sp.]
MPSVRCGWLHDIVWDESSKEPDKFLQQDSVHVWSIFISSNLDLIPKFSEILSSDEHERASKYHQQKDTDRFLVSRIALRILLSRYLKIPPQEIGFVKDENKKPYIENKGKENLHYNVSHSGDCILIAISNSEVGADIEKIDEDFPYQEIMIQNFSAIEMQFINSTKKSAENFYALWTRKESLLKATSKGIDESLPDVPSLEGMHKIKKEIIGSENDWMVNTFNIEKDYIGSIGCRYNNPNIRFYNANKFLMLLNA